MKNMILLLSSYSIALMGFCVHAQNDCETIIEQAETILFKNSPFIDQSELVSLLQPCAVDGNAQAENYLGLVYLKGIGTKKDAQKAFKHIYSAALKGYPNAQYNLGRLYKYGLGCELSFDAAIQWFETATANGNQRAAYSLGYMYFKGFGVPQDYKKSVYWFEKSDDPMAKHFLAICNYFGYGTPINEQRAVELLTANPTLNSKTFLTYVKANLRTSNEDVVAQNIHATTDATHIKPNVVEMSAATDTYKTPLTEQDLQGEWVGKLVEYDWSGTRIVRVSPLALAFETENNNVQIAGTIANQHKEATAQFDNSTLYVDSDTSFTLKKLYSSTPHALTLDYTLFSMALEKTTFQNQDYLVGAMDTFILSWTEYGNPMRVVLKPKDAQGSINMDMIEALAAQKDQFIKLYPVPFYDSLTVQYQLETTSQVFVELYSLHGSDSITILPTTLQQAGDYTYTIPVSPGLAGGLYVVRLIAGNQTYTRMVIKDD